MENNEPNRRIFQTPLSVQRYLWVQQYISSDSGIKSVTDLGCGNGRINTWLKSISHLETINFVDCDRYLLEDQIEYYFMPGTFDMIFGRQNSEKDLNIKVYHGNITVPNDILSADCISMVEVIEHMPLNDVEQVSKTIFGYYQPKTVIITTPNREFNHLLRQEGEDESRFRHYDHKFEWNREEFRHWSTNVCKAYPYSVHMDGVGHLPGSEPFGPCTQIAVFKKTGSIEKVDLEKFLRNSEQDLNANLPSVKQNQKLDKIGEYQVPGRKTKLELGPIDENFDWNLCEERA